MLQIAIEFGEELGVLEITLVGNPQFIERFHQGLGDENPTIGSEMTRLVRQLGQSGLIALHFAPLR